MIKAFLIISCILFMSESANCQWYQKYFKVSDPYQLSTEQINLASQKTNDNIVGATTISILGGIGFISGMFLLLKDYPDEKYPDQAEMGPKFAGAALALISVPSEIIGLIVLNKNKLRRSEINKFLKITDIKAGFIIYPQGQSSENQGFCYLTFYSFVFRF